MGNIAAFFDIDGTLYREGLITAMFKKLIKSEIIGEQRWFNEVKDKYEKWDKRIGNYDDYLLKIAEIYVEATQGLHKSQIEFIAKKVVEQNGDRVYTYTRDKIQWHKEKGHKIIIISGSPYELVKEMAEKHGSDDFIGTKYLVDERHYYTGKIEPMWDSSSKEGAIIDFVKTYDIDLEKSYSYGDTAGDFSMLKLTGYSTAVNPTKELLQKLRDDISTKSKVQVVVERKDMIYFLGLSQIYL